MTNRISNSINRLVVTTRIATENPLPKDRRNPLITLGDLRESMLEEQKPPFIIDLNSLVSPAILGEILGYNVSLLYQDKQKGIVFTEKEIKDYTYREAIHDYLKCFKKSAEAKRLKAQAEIDAKKARTVKYGGDGDDSMHPVMVARQMQATRKDKAMEEQIYQKIAIERGDYLSTSESLELAKPFIMTIRDELIAATLDHPELTEVIDRVMESLHKVGLQLMEEAEEDSKAFITEMLTREIEND